jgi:hypothetical protein
LGTVGDSITIAKHDTPVVALITDRFWQQSALVARAHGLTDVPRVALPYPVAGTGSRNLQRVAREVVPEVLRALGLAPLKSWT